MGRYNHEADNAPTCQISAKSGNPALRYSNLTPCVILDLIRTIPKPSGTHSARLYYQTLTQPGRRAGNGSQALPALPGRAMRRWVIDDLTNFPRPFVSAALFSGWISELREPRCIKFWKDEGQSSFVAWQVCFRFQICWSVLKRERLYIEPKFDTFYPYKS